MRPITISLLGALIAMTTTAQADALIAKNGTAQAAIFVAPEVMAADKPVNAQVSNSTYTEEMSRRRLRDSVKDLSLYLGKISGAKFEIIEHAPTPADKVLPLLIGDYATSKFGPLKAKNPFAQTWRLAVRKDAIAFMGESGESTSYALYELLDQLGCRWFVPGDLGEVIPQTKTIVLPERDVTSVPSTLARNIWYADDDYKRRNRLTDQKISAGHALERYITAEQRKQHPEWCATINGKPHPVRLKWSLKAVSDAVADSIIANLDKNYTPSVSLSPEDGAEFDETDDKALDAGDWDTSMNTVSLTDRYVNFCNRVAERVTQKYPDVRFGFLAYVQYTRPPVREKPHPNLVPEIAPITYCRAHAMTDTAICNSRPQMRAIIEGWGQAAPGRVAYYNYMYHLAEITVPYPMIHQMKSELPLLYANGVTFWQPETLPNFDSSLPALWLSYRMAWNKDLQPDAVLQELYTRYYGSAATPMARYWQTIDDAWTNSSEHAGCGFGYLKRFSPETIKAARAAMDEALAAAATPIEYRRVKLHDDSLRQFERFLQLRRDVNEGRLANLDIRSNEWSGTQTGLGAEYALNFAFSKVYWTPSTVGGHYYRAFFQATDLDAAKMAAKNVILGKPLRQWKYQVAEKQDGTTLGWQDPTFADTNWKSTDSGLDTWYDLGLEGYYGTVWYRQSVKGAKIPEGKKLHLWLAATDGNVQVFINGQPISYIDEKGQTQDKADGFCQPFAFDITSAWKPEGENQITLACTRTFLNELGTGGLLGPAYLFREK